MQRVVDLEVCRGTVIIKINFKIALKLSCKWANIHLVFQTKKYGNVEMRGPLTGPYSPVVGRCFFSLRFFKEKFTAILLA